MTLVEPHSDPDLQQETRVVVGGGDRTAFAQISVAVSSKADRQRLTGWVGTDSSAPTITADLINRIGSVDAGESTRLTATVISCGAQTRELASLIANPSRRLPVIVTTRTPRAVVSSDVAEAAHECAGIAHFFDIEADEEADHLQRLIGEQFTQRNGEWRVFFAGWTPGDDPGAHPQWGVDRQHDSRHGSFGFTVARRLISMAAFRVVEPPWIEAVATADGRNRVRQLRAEIESRPSITDDMLSEWETDLARLDQAEADLDSLRRELVRVTAENKDLRNQAAAHDNQAAETTRGPGDQPARFQTVSEAVAAAAQRCPNLEFLPQAVATATACGYRWPERIYEDFVLLDTIAGEWQRTGRLEGGWKEAPKAAGLGWVPRISTTAKDRYSCDYTVTLANGDRVLLGPHLRRGATTGGSGHYRAYLHIDETERKVYVGYIGKHLRDATNR